MVGDLGDGNGELTKASSVGTASAAHRLLAGTANEAAEQSEQRSPDGKVVVLAWMVLIGAGLFETAFAVLLETT